MSEHDSAPAQTPASRPQPVAIAGAITTAIPAIVGLLVTTGILDLAPAAAGDVSTAGQQIVAGVLTVVTLVVGLVATLRARAVVTPLSAPALRSGAPARLVPVKPRPRVGDETAGNGTGTSPYGF